MIRRAPKCVQKFVDDCPIVAVGAAAAVLEMPADTLRARIGQRLVDIIDHAESADVVVGAGPAATDPATSAPVATPKTDYGFLLPTGIGAAVGVGAGLLFHASPIFIGSLGVVGGGVGFIISKMTVPSKSMTPKCPDVASPQFQAVLADIKTGKENADTAETVAKNYDTQGCADAAKQIRGAVPPSKGSISKSGLMPGPTLPTPPPTPLKKPSIGSSFVKHKLTAAEAAEQVFTFRIDAGFTSDLDFLAANGAIAVFPASGKKWPPAVPFQYVAYGKTGGDPTDDYWYWDKALTFTPTGKIASGLNQPTYMGPDGVEYYFPDWTGSTTTKGGGGYTGFSPQRVVASAGQRMTQDAAVWVWDEGLLVNIHTDSNIGKADAAAKGDS